MGGRLSGVTRALYDPKRKEVLGRDGAGWAKLGIFYFFFYIGLAGFFCAMLAVFMAVTPRDRPRYILEDSRMETRSNPLSPGLGFRPQPDIEKNLILVSKNKKNYSENTYVKSLNQYLNVYYPQSNEPVSDKRSQFSIRNPGGCTSANDYGFRGGQPCVLVKMNKIVGFQPLPGVQPEDKNLLHTAGCETNAIPVYCYGEYPADVDNIGDLTYFSERGQDNRCGSLERDRFPYEGKVDRQDYYQAPYVWVQFNRPKKNVLINVICRVFADNISFGRKTGRGLTRFQVFIRDDRTQKSL